MVQAQGHDAHWIFGMGYHMEFIGGVPAINPRIEGYLAQEGVSTVSDKDGELLFYSNAEIAWNALHLALENSDSIASNSLRQSRSLNPGNAAHLCAHGRTTGSALRPRATSWI